MKIHRKPFLAFPFLIILFCSCEKIIDFKGDELEDKIVVNALLLADNKITASITRSRSLLSDQPFFETIKVAKADLYVNDRLVETLRYESRPDTITTPTIYGLVDKIPYDKGVYVSKTRVEAGKTYRLEVSCNGMQSVSCETTVPYPVEILSVDTTTKEIDYGYGYGSRLVFQVKFKDPGDRNNYYRFQSDYTEGIPEVLHTNNNEPLYTDIVHTREYYEQGYNMVDPIFKGSENEANDIVMGTPENRFSIFEDSKINGSEYKLTHIFRQYWRTDAEDLDNGGFIEQRLSLYVLHKDYFDYLNTLNYQDWFSEDYFAEPISIYSNVKGGLGIWSSANISRVTFTLGTYPMPGKTYRSFDEY